MLCKSPSYLSSLNHKKDPYFFFFFISEITFIWNFLEPEPKIANHFGSGSEILELFRRARMNFTKTDICKLFYAKILRKGEVAYWGVNQSFSGKSEIPAHHLILQRGGGSLTSLYLEQNCSGFM